MRQHFIKTKDSHNYRTRNGEFNFLVPSVNGPASKTFYFNAIKDWNNLPMNLKKLKQEHAFKAGVKDCLFELQNIQFQRDFLY